MSDILCHWLNQEVGLSAHCSRENLTVLFKNGYYFGEILYKYGIVTNYTLLNETKISIILINKIFSNPDFIFLKLLLSMHKDLEMFSPKNTDNSIIRNYALLRPLMRQIDVEVSPHMVSEIKRDNLVKLKSLIYNTYVALKRKVGHI